MRHRVGYNRLGRKASHRHAMMKNMATSLLRHERIKTTVPKAKEVRRLVEKLITRAKVDSLHNRRIVAQTIGDKAVLAKLFVELGPRFETRPGGYTRILKIGQRRGDAAEMAILELVEEMDKPAKKAPKKSSKKEAQVEKAPVKDESPAEEQAKEEEDAVETADAETAEENAESADAGSDESAEDTVEESEEKAESDEKEKKEAE